MFDNTCEICGSSTSIEVIRTNGERFVVLVDTPDLELLKEHNHKVGIYKHPFYKEAYARIKVNRRWVALHRWLINAPSGLLVDHINHNTLDNRRTNLRLATDSENQQNRSGAESKSKSGIRGVHWRDSCRKWVAEIRVNRKKKHIGYFNSAEEADKAVKAARARYMPFSQEALLSAGGGQLHN